MKIKTARMDYDKVMALPRPIHQKPVKPNMFFRALLRIAGASDLRAVNFKYTEFGTERLGKDEPALFLMNHSSFIDLKIAAKVLYPRPFNIVCTSDGFVGKNWLMRHLGCIPTKKFITDTQLVKDMAYAVRTLKSSVLLYPEASYSFDGTATPLPESMGKFIKFLGVPVVMIRTRGAFLRDPLYNGLRLRNTDVTAELRYVLSTEEIKEKSVAELNAILKELFSFDNFADQRQSNVRITEPFRAEGLNRVLYKCPACKNEGCMTAKDDTVACTACGKAYRLTELGSMEAIEGGTEYTHIPDWYKWERSCVRDEIEQGVYKLDVPVDICMMVNTDCIYEVGEGRLVHDTDGFRLTGCEGRLDYRQAPLSSYSLYSDYYWYEIGDVICIGDTRALYYCFPKNCGDIVAKTRLAAEELYSASSGK